MEQFFLRLMEEVSIINHKDPMTRYEMWMKLHPDVADFTPQYMIADMINVTPVHLSRLRARFAGKAPAG